MNVIEIDAASNNGVDNIREIREEVAYSPTEGKYKVYIIDEVHMLSIGAFNALLKTLEEPPSYVIFILATTEAHKIPITILSRCQRYDFKRITIDTIAGRLQDLMEQEQVVVEEKALRYIAKAADGSMRDALSLLDQCIAFYLGKELTYDHVLDVLGAVDTDVYSGMLRKLLNRQLVEVITELEQLIMQGKELTQFVTDFTWYLRNLLLVKSSDDMEDVLDVSTENLRQLKEEAEETEPETLMRYIRIFSELSSQIKYSAQKRVLIEIALIKLCKPAMERNYDSILARLSDIERQLEQGVPVAVQRVQTDGAYSQRAAEPVQEAKPAVKAASADVQKVIDNWKVICDKMPQPLPKFLKPAEVRFKEPVENHLCIVVSKRTTESFLKEGNMIPYIEEAIESRIQKKVEVEICSAETDTHKEIGILDIQQKIGIPIEIEEF